MKKKTYNLKPIWYFSQLNLLFIKKTDDLFVITGVLFTTSKKKNAQKTENHPKTPFGLL
jgi:hypothetical protein